jgi:hypothetical protein
VGQPGGAHLREAEIDVVGGAIAPTPPTTIATWLKELSALYSGRLRSRWTKTWVTQTPFGSPAFHVSRENPRTYTAGPSYARSAGSDLSTSRGQAANR